MPNRLADLMRLKMKILYRNIARFFLIFATGCPIPVFSATLTCNSEGQTIEVIRAVQIVVIGEVHGSKEIPNLVENLLCLLSKKSTPYLLALEMPTSEQEGLDLYANSSEAISFEDVFGKSVFWNKTLHDGRSSVAIAQLIEKARELSKQGAMLKVVAFDSGSRGTRSPSENFGDNLKSALEKNPGYKMLVLTGRLHAANRREETSTNKTRITDLAGEYRLLNLQGIFNGGQTWSCRGLTIAELSCGPKGVDPMSTEVEFENSLYFGERFKPMFLGAYFVGTLTPSPPRFLARIGR